MALTPEQQRHNIEMDLKKAEIDNFNKMQDELDRIAMERWAQFLKENPDYPFKSCPGLTMIRKTFIGYYYV